MYAVSYIISIRSIKSAVICNYVCDYFKLISYSANNYVCTYIYTYHIAGMFGGEKAW